MRSAGQIIAAAVLTVATCAWCFGALLVAYAGHAAISNYWGHEWPNADRDFAHWLTLWVLAALALGGSWFGLWRTWGSQARQSSGGPGESGTEHTVAVGPAREQQARVAIAMGTARRKQARQVIGAILLAVLALLLAAQRSRAWAGAEQQDPGGWLGAFFARTLLTAAVHHSVGTAADLPILVAQVRCCTADSPSHGSGPQFESVYAHSRECWTSVDVALRGGSPNLRSAVPSMLR